MFSFFINIFNKIIIFPDEHVKIVFLPQIFYNYVFLQPLTLVIIRVAPDTDLAGYPANNFARYRISGLFFNLTIYVVGIAQNIYSFVYLASRISGK